MSHPLKRNVGRPPKEPTGAITALTLKIPSDVKRKLIDDADSVGMTLTEYLITLIQKQWPNQREPSMMTVSTMLVFG